MSRQRVQLVVMLLGLFVAAGSLAVELGSWLPVLVSGVLVLVLGLFGPDEVFE